MKLLPAFAALVLASCSITITGNLYPVDGQLSKTVPVPVIPLKIHNVERNSGTVDMVLPSGEICKGHWSVAAPRMVGTASTTASGSISSGLDSAFISMHGSSFINVARPGVNKGQAMLVGDRGSVIECAFLVGSGTASGYGTAKDNKDNVFKVIF
ncbi:hypothetical protein OJ996_14265 [Luteolibacter sp. GHJ8]|uniref:Lipoprotein n=1 Tax=Luteolibacter rhizosphaerae TaxID=2989719 RepID=A0ABT3G4J8_9BACT|nr:hypothetical protein [Luteolibacter rhizosphaerae]MCW1914748.1 hypothetical protein [Luteolibacter rhizosphaerae]